MRLHAHGCRIAGRVRTSFASSTAMALIHAELVVEPGLDGNPSAPLSGVEQQHGMHRAWIGMIADWQPAMQR